MFNRFLHNHNLVLGPRHRNGWIRNGTIFTYLASSWSSLSSSANCQRIRCIGEYIPSYLLNEACPGSCELGAAFEPAGAWLLIWGAGAEYWLEEPAPSADISFEAIAAGIFYCSLIMRKNNWMLISLTVLSLDWCGWLGGRMRVVSGESWMFVKLNWIELSWVELSWIELSWIESK